MKKKKLSISVDLIEDTVTLSINDRESSKAIEVKREHLIQAINDSANHEIKLFIREAEL